MIALLFLFLLDWCLCETKKKKERWKDAIQKKDESIKEKEALLEELEKQWAEVQQRNQQASSSNHDSTFLNNLSNDESFKFNFSFGSSNAASIRTVQQPPPPSVEGVKIRSSTPIRETSSRSFFVEENHSRAPSIAQSRTSGFSKKTNRRRRSGKHKR